MGGDVDGREEGKVYALEIQDSGKFVELME